MLTTVRIYEPRDSSEAQRGGVRARSERGCPKAGSCSVPAIQPARNRTESLSFTKGQLELRTAGVPPLTPRGQQIRGSRLTVGH